MFSDSAVRWTLTICLDRLGLHLDYRRRRDLISPIVPRRRSYTTALCDSDRHLPTWRTAHEESEKREDVRIAVHAREWGKTSPTPVSFWLPLEQRLRADLFCADWQRGTFTNLAEQEKASVMESGCSRNRTKRYGKSLGTHFNAGEPQRW